MRQIVKKTFGVPITIELLEKLQLPPSSSSNNTMTSGTTQIINTNAINHQQQQQPQQQQQQQHPGPVIQQPLYTTVQPPQKINILQQTPQHTLIGSTASLLSQQQQQQQQARAQIVCSLICVLFDLEVIAFLEYYWLSSHGCLDIPLRKYESSWWTTTTTSSACNTTNHSPIRFLIAATHSIGHNVIAAATNHRCQPSTNQTIHDSHPTTVRRVVDSTKTPH
jgi:hypothetical protein